MTERSTAHYHEIAGRLSPSSRAFIDGRFVAARSGATFETSNPATGEVIAAVAHCQAEDVDVATASARRAFADGAWSRAAPETRKLVLLRLADLVRANAEDLAVLESLESGKPIRDCLREIGEEVPNTFQWYAELIDKTFGKVAATGEAALAMIVREPAGVAGLVLPWNFPLLMAAWKLAPALASGCSTVVKPAEQTSLTALRLAELASEAGLPDGVLNVLPGMGETAGQAIGRHPDIDLVSFTGSTQVGAHFLRYASESNLKPVGLEMGGKSPFIVLDDAEISDDLVENAVTSAFWNGGQNCSANMRQIVAMKVRDEFLDRVVKRTAQLRIGDPLDPETDMGPMVSDEQRSRVTAYLESGRGQGARTALSLADAHGRASGSFLGPTVFDDVTPQMTIAREEIFGPVLGVIPVGSVEQALQTANDTVYGLHATIYTRDLDKALFMARRLACGTVSVNRFTEGDLKTPFGGYKRSGSFARDKGVEAMDQYLQTKTIWITTHARWS